MELHEFLQPLEGVKGTGDQYTARCPAHEDRHQSLSVARGEDGRILLKCHAGCSVEAVVAAMGLSISDLFPGEEETANVPKRVVATYDYLDAQGTLQYQKVRYSPKGFSQRRPDGQGGWAYNLKGVQCILYNLPAVLEGDTIWIVEGEKDVETLKAKGKTATCNPGGAGRGKWLSSYNDCFKNKSILIIPDNDRQGKDFAREIACSLASIARSVKLLDLTLLWPELPDKGDVTDFFNHGGTLEELEALAEAAKEFGEWEPPIPFDVHDLPSFPIHSLPAVLRDYALAVAESVQVSVDMAAVMGLGVMAMCVQKKFRIEGKRDWRKPLNLFVAVVAPPAERKSAVVQAMTEPVFTYEREENQRLQPEIDENEMRRDVLEKEIKRLTERAAQGKASMESILEKKQELSALPQIKPVCLWTADATPEALVSLIAENGGRAAVLSAEGGIFQILNGRYSNSVNVEDFLNAHSGDAIRVDRKGRASEYVYSPALTVALAIQPFVLDGLIGNDEFRGRGLPARFLYATPKSPVGTRRYETRGIPLHISAEYKELVFRLLSIPLPEVEQIITLSEEAKSLVSAFFYELEPLLPGELEAMGDWAGKLHGATLRIAGVLHAVEHKGEAAGVEVSAQIMAGAIHIGRYFLTHAKAAFTLMGADEATKNARYILRQLEKQQLTEISRTELTRLCRGRFKQAEAMDSAIRLLLEHNYCREVQVEYSGKGRRPEPKLKINPASYGMNGNNGNNGAHPLLNSIHSIVSSRDDFQEDYFTAGEVVI